ncbi:MAG TPA: cytochrome c-type biogenesis protein CcmH [Gemmatimonadaceae bacterium]|nr:cytochrome c-type biogenesis protein CcmH [Gemmatimonadaceae bacterium]HRQ77373.1 cytochrome c-type biogenesis protein CcmH [Gemmatimonadaceae bacterium]
MLTRREWFVAAAGAGVALSSRVLGGQQTNFTPMDQSAYRPVMRDPKPGATPSMTPEERDRLERELKCQCTCILDVYTCRTTDFTCSVSPAMHRDVMRLVEGGYTAQEIKDAFVATYGEVALTAPVKQGFNWAGYFAPAVVMTTGGIVLTMMIKRWTQRAAATTAAASATGTAAGAVPPIDASADELARLEKALREEDFE